MMPLPVDCWPVFADGGISLQCNMYGPQYGYFPNAVKTWLIFQEDKQAEAVQLFEETGVNITTTGK